jgi:hypothetical protein
MNNQYANFPVSAARQEMFAAQFEQSKKALAAASNYFGGLTGRKMMMSGWEYELPSGLQLRVNRLRGHTSFIVSEGGGGTMYLVNGEFHSYEEAVLGLFKKLMIDDREHAVNYYGLVKDFFISYFKKVENNSLSMTLTGKWKGQFVHLDLETVTGMGGSLISMQVGGKELMVSLHTHPLVDHLG